MKFPAILRRLDPSVAAVWALGLLAASAVLLFLHARAVREMREVGLPAAVELPRIEKRMTILREQNDVAQLQAMLRGGSQEDVLRMHVIPRRADVDRLLAAIDVLVSHLEKEGMLSRFGGVHIGDPVATGSGEARLPVSFDADLTREGLAAVSRFVDASGLLTVADALSPSDIAALLALTESDGSDTIAALEYFLSTDLLRHAEDPASHDDRLIVAFTPSSEEQLRAIIMRSDLQRLREFLRGIDAELRDRRLSPLRLLTLRTAAIESIREGTMSVSFELDAYVRER